LLLVGETHLVATAESMSAQFCTAPFIGKIHSQTRPPPQQKYQWYPQRQVKRRGTRSRRSSSSNRTLQRGQQVVNIVSRSRDQEFLIVDVGSKGTIVAPE
jgi:hypothetical protein